MSTTLRVMFLDYQSCRIPLADLMALCRIGSDYALALPVASKATFDKFQTYVSKHRSATETADQKSIHDWDEEYMEVFKDQKELDELAMLAERACQHGLKDLCAKRGAELSFGGGQGEGDEGDDEHMYMNGDDYGDANDDDDYYSDDDTMPSPDVLPKDEDKFWEDYQREEYELYKGDWDTSSPENMESPSADGTYREDSESPSS